MQANVVDATIQLAEDGPQPDRAKPDSYEAGWKLMQTHAGNLTVIFLTFNHRVPINAYML
jgi:hypothetical protein